MNIKITSIDELKMMASGEVVELPPFAQGQHFYAKLRRPSMMRLAESGKIPNSLLNTANTLFSGTVEQKLDADDDFMKDMFSLIDVLADSVFVEPSWTEIKEANIQLTDEQYMFIFNYTQQGVRSYEPFREDESGDGTIEHVENVQV